MSEDVLIQHIKRLERKVDKLLSEQVKEQEVWVKVTEIRNLTGWDKEKMRRMRNSGILKMKKDPKAGIMYNLSALPQQFISNYKNHTHGTN